MEGSLLFFWEARGSRAMIRHTHLANAPCPTIVILRRRFLPTKNLLYQPRQWI